MPGRTWRTQGSSKAGPAGGNVEFFPHQQKKIPFGRTGHFPEETHSAPTAWLAPTLFGDAWAEPRLRNAAPAETGLRNATRVETRLRNATWAEGAAQAECAAGGVLWKRHIPLVPPRDLPDLSSLQKGQAGRVFFADIPSGKCKQHIRKKSNIPS